MEHRSALTLKSGDVISIPGIGTKMIGAVNQIHHDRYQIKLVEKFVESIDLDVVITNGEHRTPERHDGPWKQGNNVVKALSDRLQEAALDLHVHGHTTANTPLLGGLYHEAASALQGGNNDPKALFLVDKLCRRVVLGTQGDEGVDIELLEESARFLSSTSLQE